jgi:hypothetical protein
MRKWLLLAALLLPVLWLGGTALLNQRALGTASEWRIPIEGYDPRDPLRGQYIRFSYRWEVEGDESLCKAGTCAICLSQEADTVIATLSPAGTQCTYRIDPEASSMDIRPGFGDRPQLLFGSRMFVSEARAPQLEAWLLDRPMVVVAALTPDGRLINRRIEPANAPAR